MPVILDKQIWAEELLKTMGNSNPSPNAIKFVQAWEIHESGSGASIGCDHNPLNIAGPPNGQPFCNCLQSQGGSCVFGVLQFQQGNDNGYTEGLQATAQRLQAGNYPNVSTALLSNNETALGFTGHMSTEVQGDLSVWVSGKRSPIAIDYVNAILKLIGQPTLPAGGDIGQAKGGSNSGPSANPLQQIGDFLSNIGPWFSNPTRLIKLLAGVALIVGSVFVMMQPESMLATRLKGVTR
jgi:hypothetical protein